MLSRHVLFIVSFMVVMLLLGLSLTLWQPDRYVTSVAFSVHRINKERSQYYDESYFSQQASDIFSQTVISWFLTPSILLEMYEKAELDPNIDSLSRFANRFKAKKNAAQNIVVTFEERSEDASKKIAQAMIDVVERRGAELNTSAENKSLFEIRGTKPVIVRKTYNAPVIVVGSLLVGLLGGVVLVYVWRYLNNPLSVKKDGGEAESG